MIKQKNTRSIAVAAGVFSALKGVKRHLYWRKMEKHVKCGVALRLVYTVSYLFALFNGFSEMAIDKSAIKLTF